MRHFRSRSLGHPVLVAIVLALLVALMPTAIAATQEELEWRAQTVERQIADLRADIATLAAAGADGDDLRAADRWVDRAERRVEQARRYLADAAAIDAGTYSSAEGEGDDEGDGDEDDEDVRDADRLRERAASRLDDAEDAVIEAQARLIISVLNDETLAAAVNTDDGESIFAFAFAIEMVSDDVVETGNSALAIASCIECVTLAIATQILFITGDAGTISPENLALAINADCTMCQTAAFAYQIVYTTPEDFRLSGDARAAIEEIRREMWLAGRAFERGELNAFELDAALDPLVAELDAIVGAEVDAALAELAAVAPSPSPSPSVTAIATSEPSESPTESASPDPPESSTASQPSDSSASSSPTPTATGSAEPEPTPSATSSSSP